MESLEKQRQMKAALKASWEIALRQIQSVKCPYCALPLEDFENANGAHTLCKALDKERRK